MQTMQSLSTYSQSSSSYKEPHPELKLFFWQPKGFRQLTKLHQVMAAPITIGFFGLMLFISSFSTAQAQCTLTLKPTVSGCYYVNGTSKATVSIEVAWSGAATGEKIVVTGPAGSVPATRTITTGTFSVTYTANITDGVSVTGTQTIVSPQVVSFEIPADGTTGLSASANFITASTCLAVSPAFSAPIACVPVACASGQTGGVVYNDFDANGVKAPGESSGIAGVTVKAYDCTGALVGTTTSDADGNYAFSGLTAANYPIRVEFSTIPTLYGQGTPYGTDAGTTTQFVAAPSCNINLGVLDPSDYCQAVPNIFVPCYVNGDPLPVGSASGAKDALVMFGYDASGLKNATLMTELATAAEVGSLWGTAYNKFTKVLYSSSVVRRHAGLGPKGIGGLYMINPGTSSATGFDLGALGVNTGTIPDNATRGLLTALSSKSQDAEAFAAIGKQGLGDLEISEDGKYLFVVSLADKKLNRLDISGSTPTLAGSYAIPDPGCVGGNWQPFATKANKGKIYVGGVCNAETSQDKSDLRAYVYTFDEASTTFNTAPIFDFPLTYPKGFPLSGTSGQRNITGWYPWTDDFNSLSLVVGSGNFVVYPQPMLTDIEIDVDGSMVLAFGDRTGMQIGNANLSPIAGDASLYVGISGGDILRAFKKGNAYVLENNAIAGPTTGYDINNNQGPGFGEFYNDNFLNLGGHALDHTEQVFGALALKPGSGEVAVTVMDPVDWPAGANVVSYKNSAGVKFMSNTTGDASHAYQVYASSNGDAGTFSKSVGLGDLELSCDAPDYLELGNRVWIDLDKDGVQDPCETPMAGIIIQLLDNIGTLVATKTTDANGQYLFGKADGLLPNTAYKIIIGATQYDGTKLTLNGINYETTIANNTTGSGNDLNDSDASVVASQYMIAVNTGNSATVNHTLDAGFIIGCPSPNCYPTTVTKN